MTQRARKWLRFGLKFRVMGYRLRVIAKSAEVTVQLLVQKMEVNLKEQLVLPHEMVTITMTVP